MPALLARLRAEARHRWRSWLVLAILIGVFGGATLGTIAGARRTDSAYRRLLARSHPFDMFLLNETFSPEIARITPQQLHEIPLVSEVVTAGFLATEDGPELIGSADPRFDVSFNKPKIVSGRAPNQARADELAVPVAIASEQHLTPGKTVTLRFLDQDEKTHPFTFRVAAIIAEPGEFPPESDLGPPRIHVTQAFFAREGPRLGAFPYSLVRLRHGSADLPAFRAALTELGGGKPVLGYTQAALTKNVNRSFHLQAASLAILGLFLAVVVLLVFGQALGRVAMQEASDFAALRALGATRSDLALLGIMRGALIAITGALVAVVVAFLGSPLAPTGLARAADPSPGFRLDGIVLGVGAVVVFTILMLFNLVPAVRAAYLASNGDQLGWVESASDRRSAGAVLAARAGLSAPAVVGMRFALEPGRGRTAVPVRTTIAGVMLGIAALTMSLTFGSSLRHLLNTPRLYGLTWDAVAGADEDLPPDRAAAALRVIRADPHVADAQGGGGGAPFLINGVQADGLATVPGDSSFTPPITQGRVPTQPDEIVVGPKTLRAIHARIGDVVDVSVVGVRARPYRVVGVGIIPTVGHTANLGEGALVSPAGIATFFGHSTGVGEFVIRFHPGVDAASARFELEKRIRPFGLGIQPPNTPGDLLNFGRSKNLPFVLSGLLALLAAATLAHALVSSISRRRRDLAVLKGLGMIGRQVGGTIRWQASTMLLVAIAVGVPAGVAFGRWLWDAYAQQLGVLSVPRAPLRAIGVLIPSAFILALIVAVFPARAAARTRAAVVLRTE
jgi:putative ABC transport system permease protein